MEEKLSGLVLLSFTVDERGAPRDIEANGDALLTPEVLSAFRYAQLPRQCSGTRISIAVTFRIDSGMPSQNPISVRQISQMEYEVVSPYRNISVISDPPMTWQRPGKPFVEVSHIGEDGLTVRLSDALESAFDESRDFTPSNGKRPGTLVVIVPRHVGWKETGRRVHVLYSVEFMTADGVNLGRSEGRCREDAIRKCASQVLKDAKRVAQKAKLIADH